MSITNLGPSLNGDDAHEEQQEQEGIQSRPILFPPIVQPRRPANTRTATPSDDTRVSRSAILAAARALVGHRGPYLGPISVKVVVPELGTEIRVTPIPGVDGLPPTGPPTAGSLITTAAPAELLAVLFSRDEIRMLAEMLTGLPVKACNVLAASKVEKSKFYPIWANLQQRGVVVDAEEGEGFLIGPAWVKEMIRAKVEGMKAFRQ